MALPVNLFLTYETTLSGQAANVIARVYSADGTAQGTLRATVTANWQEDFDETGATCGYLNNVAADASWGAMLRVKYTIVGVPGAGYDAPWMDYGAFFVRYTPFNLPIPVENLVYQATQQSQVALNVNFRWFQGILEPKVWNWTDQQGNPISLAGKTIKFRAWIDSGDAQTGELQHDNGTTGGITVSGTNNNVVTLTPTSGDLASARVYRYILWDDTTPAAISAGAVDIVPTRLVVP